MNLRGRYTDPAPNSTPWVYLVAIKQYGRPGGTAALSTTFAPAFTRRDQVFGLGLAATEGVT